MSTDREDLPMTASGSGSGSGPVDPAGLDQLDALPPGRRLDDAVAELSVHGLLRAMHTADAEAHDARIRAILGGVPASRVRSRRHRLTVVAASVVALVGVALFTFPDADREPRVEALVARAARVLAEPVDRRYELRVTYGPPWRRQTELTRDTVIVRPGGRFFLERRTLFGAVRIGCDGSVVWRQSSRDPDDRWTIPVSDTDLLRSKLGRLGLLDAGYLDLERLVAGLPEAGQLRLVGRETRAELGDGELLRIEANRLRTDRFVGLRNVVLLVDDATGHVVSAEMDARGRRGRGALRVHVSLTYVGEAPTGERRYRRPW